MYKSLYLYLQGNNILYRYQFGFRQNHSTALALIDVVDSIYKYLDHNETVIGLYLDLQKAFDTENHKILLQKLNSVRGIVLDWLNSYLSGKKQFTTVNNCVVGIHHRSRGNAWSPSSIVLGVPSYITLTGRQLLSLPRMQMTHYLVQSPILPIISSMSFYPDIPIIHITLDQGPTVSNSLTSMMIVILLTECFLHTPTRYVYDC